MTNRLYYTNSYRTEFDAVVTAVTEYAGRPAIVLDETCFYPTSGGQPYDTGTLAGVAVIDVIADDEAVYHIVSEAPEASLVGQSVHGQIDWPRRFDHMQQHAGQHLISQFFQDEFGYETVSVHFGDEESTLDLNTESVSDDELAEAERLVNEAVFQAVPIRTYFITDAEVDTIPLRKAPAVCGKIRIVEIEGRDWSACGGTHTRSTAEIGPVKFIRQQRMRGQARLTFLCGRRALEDYARKHALITEAAMLYDNEIGLVPVLIHRDMERLKELQQQVTELREYRLTILASELVQDAASIGKFHIVAQIIDDLEPADVKQLANLCIEQSGVVALLACNAGGKATVIFGRSADMDLHAGNLLRTTLSEFGGGGGGRPDMAQGGGVSPDVLDALLDYAKRQATQELEAAA